MKYLKDAPGSDDADSAEDTIVSTVAMEQRLQAVHDKLRELPADSDPRERANLQLQVAGTLVDLDRATEAWEIARRTFDELLELEDWEHAVLACDILFQADQEGSLAALGQGLWMAVTYPIDPELTVAMLEHVVEETPDDSDGAAVAAATACYITDLRAEGRKRDDLMFFTNNLLGTVARRHSNVNTQDEFDSWFKRLELHDPAAFLPRLRNVIDVMVQDDWWLDRDALTQKLPVN